MEYAMPTATVITTAMATRTTIIPRIGPTGRGEDVRAKRWYGAPGTGKTSNIEAAS
jgi:hypothetical protein